jgi:hypothetical protein
MKERGSTGKTLVATNAASTPGDRLAHDALGAPEGIDLRGVDEVDPEVERARTMASASRWAYASP